MSATEYSDYAKDRNGWFFGLSGLQLALVVLAGLPELAALNSHTWPMVLGWFPVWGLLVALVAVPVRGWTASQWLLALASHALGELMGWTRWQSKVAAGTVTDLDEADLPGVLSAVQTHDGPPFGHAMTRVAVIQDHAAHTWAAVARIEHPGIGMAEAEERSRMAAGLAELQEIASRTELIDLVAIQVRTVPDDGAERADWVRRHRKATSPVLAGEVNDTLSAHLMPAAVRSEAFVTVVVGEGRIAKSAKQSGGGVDGRSRVLYGALGEVESRLRGAIGCTDVAWLDSPALAVAIRTGFAPGDRAALVAAELAGQDNPQIATGVPMAAAGPSSAHAEMRHYEHDAWCSVTDTILLPDQGAILGALAPVLVPSTPGERRSVTVFYPAMSQARADKVTSREEMSAIVGSELRRKSGRIERARQRRATVRVSATDEKLAKGRALVRPCAAATVTVPGTWSIAEFGRRLDASIRLAGFVPQRLDGAQDAAFAAGAIPLGIGVPRRRGQK
ncbi:MAG TPA: SCO6880 family protein [Jatrophihabitantaceae bacterium]|jgi:hypothetical protein